MSAPLNLARLNEEARAIHLGDQEKRERFLAGEWTPVSRVGKYPQIDLTEERVEQLEKSYDPSLEMGVINLDHATEGAALGKIAGVRKSSKLVEIKLDPKEVTPELREAVLSGKFFRPSAEIYPSFSQIPGSPAYLRGVALLGNKSAQVRGLPRIEFSAGGEKYVGLHDDQRGDYVCLDGADSEVITMSDDKKDKDKTAPEVARLEAEKADLAAKAKTQSDEIAKLKADLAAKDQEAASLSGRVKAIELQAAEDKKKSRKDGIVSRLEALRKAKKISPAQESILLAAMPEVQDTAADVVKLGSGETAKSYDLLGALFAALEAGRTIDLPFEDRMKSGDIEALASLDDCADRAKELTEAKIDKGELKLGAESQAFYLATCAALEKKFQAAQN